MKPIQTLKKPFPETIAISRTGNGYDKSRQYGDRPTGTVPEPPGCDDATK